MDRSLPKPKKWDIFLSCRRSETTEEAARWLKNELEKEPIVSTTGQRFTLEVFVDVTQPRRPNFQLNLTPLLEHSRALNGGLTIEKAPFIVAQLDSKSGRTLLSDGKLKANGWDKVNCLRHLKSQSLGLFEPVPEDVILKQTEAARLVILSARTGPACSFGVVSNKLQGKTLR